jgi:hypothetical protein
MNNSERVNTKEIYKSGDKRQKHGATFHNRLNLPFNLFGVKRRRQTETSFYCLQVRN